MVILNVWRDVPGYEKFKVNRKGQIASYINNKINFMHQMLLDSGHYTVYLSITREKKRTLHVDYIVAIVFVDNPYNFKYVLHKDGNNGNNNADNLEWSPYPGLLEGEWKKIPGYSDYIVSEKGDVRSFKTKKFTLLTYDKTHCGYQNHNIYNDTKTRIHNYAHELVAMAFIPNPNNYKFVTHIDKNLRNNHYTNLKWTETSEEETYQEKEK